MLSTEHEAVLLLFRNRPTLAPGLAAGVLGVSLPEFTEARLAPTDLTEARPAAWHVDAVIELRDGATTPGAIVVEVQRNVDPRKRFTWPVYVASVRAALECPVTLLVVATTASVAQWASVPIELGPAGQITAAVLGFGAVPAIESVAAAALDPELAVLSALAHAGGSRELEVSRAAIGAIAAVVDEDRRRDYLSMVLGAASSVVGPLLRVIMRQYREISAIELELDAQGRAAALLRVLAARGIAVSEEARATIVACRAQATLDRWLDRSVTAVTIRDVLDD